MFQGVDGKLSVDCHYFHEMRQSVYAVRISQVDKSHSLTELLEFTSELFELRRISLVHVFDRRIFYYLMTVSCPFFPSFNKLTRKNG